MKRGLKLYFLLFSFLYFMIQCARYFNIETPKVINNYLTDFLCLPIVLSICLFGVRFFKSDQNLKLSFWMVFVIFLQYAVLFEFVLPKYSDLYTSDAYDVVAYGVGALFFLIIQNQEKKRDLNFSN